VISVQNLIEDLEQWKTLYVSGRLHKPVKILVSNAKVEQAMQNNLTNALRAALLMLPEDFTEDQLFTMITSLSYTG
jgi:translocator assembly and maintenance protein 41